MTRALQILGLLIITGVLFPLMVNPADSLLMNNHDIMAIDDYSFEEVWSEDFNDGNLDNWDTMGLNISGGPSIMADNLEIIDGILVAGNGPDYNVANHSSTIVYGKWAFDFYAVTGDWHHSAVYITKDGWNLEEGVENGYAIAFAQESYSVSEPGIHIAKSQDNHSTWHEYWLTPINNTWFHVEVTHLVNGTFNVYINGTQRIQWTDNELPVSSQFELALEPGCMVDNIVVSQLIEITTNTTDGELDLTLLIFGGGIVAIVAIVLVILLKRR